MRHVAAFWDRGIDGSDCLLRCFARLTGRGWGCGLGARVAFCVHRALLWLSAFVNAGKIRFHGGIEWSVDLLQQHRIVTAKVRAALAIKSTAALCVLLLCCTPPLLYPLPTATHSPATQCPPGQKEWRGWRRNWAGGKGRTKGGDRTGQTALAENGAERRRRRRKGKKGKNHCGC